MTRKLRTRLLALATALTLLAAGLAASVGSAGTSVRGASPTFGLALSTLNNPFFVTLRNGAQQATKAAGASLVVADGRDDAQTQADEVQNFITRKVSVIILNPVDSAAIVRSVKAANKAGIPVITVDRSSDGGKVVTHIASDNVLGGKLAGKLLFRLIGKQGDVGQLEGIAGTSAARDRGKGFKLALQETKGVRLAASQTASFNRDQGFTVAQNIIQANPNLKGIFAQNDEMALGAVKAAKQAGKKLVIVGFDAVADALAAIKAGSMAGTVAQQPALMGQLAVRSAAKIAAGKSVPAKQPVPVKLVTKANVAAFK